MSRYFNQRLLNYTQGFSSNSDYILYAQSDLKKMNLHNQVSIVSMSLDVISRSE